MKLGARAALAHGFARELGQTGQHSGARQEIEVVGQRGRVAGVLKLADHLVVRKDLAGIPAPQLEEAPQKALRMLEIGVNGIVGNDNFKSRDIEEELRHPTDERVFAVAEAIKQGYDIDKIHRLSRIDKWFLHKIDNIVKTEKELCRHDLKDMPRELLYKAKTRGFSDTQVAV